MARAGGASEVLPDGSGEHAREIVVDGSGEDAAEDNPQIGRRTELRAHDGTEDGACARDVEELDHEDLPSGHHDVVQPIGLADGGRHAVIGAEYALNKAAVEEITDNQSNNAQCK